MMQAVTSYAALKRMGDAARAEYLAERRARGMSDTDIFREIGLGRVERRMARQFLEARGQSGEESKLSDTLCWRCANACGGCSWSRNFIPVSGWDAIPTRIRTHHSTAAATNESYIVRQCPRFTAG